MADTLAALLHALDAHADASMEEMWTSGVRYATAHIRAAGVTFAPPSDPAAPLDVERLAMALHHTAVRNHNVGEGLMRMVCQEPSAHEDRAAAIAREYAALTPAPEEADRG